MNKIIFKSLKILFVFLFILILSCSGKYAKYKDNINDPWDNIPIVESEYIGQEYDILGSLYLSYDINMTVFSGEGFRPSPEQVCDELRKQAFDKFGKKINMIAKFNSYEQGYSYNNQTSR